MLPFKVTVKLESDIYILYADGTLDSNTKSEMEEALGKLIENKKNQIIINFKKCEYVSSEGWSVFLGVYKNISSTSGKICFCSMNPGVKQIFDFLELKGFFANYNSEQEAIQSFKK